MTLLAVNGHAHRERCHPMTFTDFLLDRYDGNVSKFCRDTTLSYRYVHLIATGRVAPELFPETALGIENATGLDVDVLFPEHLFPRMKFGRIRQAPGYAALKDALGISEKIGDTLHARCCVGAGFSEATFNRFCSVLRGMRDFQTELPFVESVFRALKIPMNRLKEIFPPEHYTDRTPKTRNVNTMMSSCANRTCNKLQKVFIADCPEARTTLRTAYDTTHDGNPIQNSVDLVEALVAGLSDQKRAIITARFDLDGDSWKSLETLADEYDCTAETIRQTEAEILTLLRKAWDWHMSGDMIVRRSANDRVFR